MVAKRAAKPSAKDKPKPPSGPGAGAKQKDVAQSAELEDPERLSRTAFVGNVSAQTTRKQLKKLFKQHGAVENVRLRGVIAANPKLPKKSALLAHRLHKDCNTLLAYVVFKRPSGGDGDDASEGGDDGDDGDDGDGGNGNGDGGGKGEACGAGAAGAAVAASDDYSTPTAEVRAACAALNLTIVDGKHLRVTPAMHTRSPVRQSVFVGNLPFDVTEEELITLFKDAGKDAGANLVGVRVTRDSETGMGRGVGFVSYDDALGVRAVVNQAGELKIRGRVVRMEPAAKEKKRNSKTFKRNAKREARRDAPGKPDHGLGAGRPDKKRKRDPKTGERVTRKDRQERGAKKSIVKVKHAARKARQADAAAARTLGGTGKT